MSEHEHYADWDGAYVLGALAPLERAAYERHLASCARCQEAVAELTPLPGLLAHVDLDVLEDVDELPPADLEQRLMAAAGVSETGFAAASGGRRAEVRWWRRTSTRVGLALAAAAAVVAAIVLPLTLGDHPASGSVQLSLRNATASALPLSAQVALAPEQWGTQVRMICRYADEHPAGEPTAGTAYAGRAYALYVVDEGGHAERVSTWRSRPGDTARTMGSTDLRLGQITRVELRDVASHTVLLSSSAS